MFLDRTQRRSTVGRTPLDEWSARRRDLYLTTHSTHYRQTSMTPVGFEPAVLEGERPHTYTLDRAATGTGFCVSYSVYFKDRNFISEREIFCSWFQTFTVFWMLYAFFWVIPPASEFYMPTFLNSVPSLWVEHCVPKRRHIKFIRRGITQKKAYNNILFLRKRGTFLPICTLLQPTMSQYGPSLPRRYEATNTFY